jgi:hypothetical protein
MMPQHKHRFKEVDALFGLCCALYSERSQQESKVGDTFANALITDSDLQNQRRVNFMLRSQLVQIDEAGCKLLEKTSKLAEEYIWKKWEDLWQSMEQYINEQWVQSQQRFEEWI